MRDEGRGTYGRWNDRDADTRECVPEAAPRLTGWLLFYPMVFFLT